MHIPIRYAFVHSTIIWWVCWKIMEKGSNKFTWTSRIFQNPQGSIRIICEPEYDNLDSPSVLCKANSNNEAYFSSSEQQLDVN